MDKYTKFILTVIAIAMIGILFKGEKIITSAHAVESHTHDSYQIYGLEIYGLEDHSHGSHTHNSHEIYGLELEDHSHPVRKYSHEHDASDIWGFDSKVRDAVNSACSVNYGIISC